MSDVVPDVEVSQPVLAAAPVPSSSPRRRSVSSVGEYATKLERDLAIDGVPLVSPLVVETVSDDIRRRPVKISEFETKDPEVPSVDIRQTGNPRPRRVPPGVWFSRFLSFAHAVCAVARLPGTKSTVRRDFQSPCVVACKTGTNDTVDICYGKCSRCGECCAESTHYSNGEWICPKFPSDRYAGQIAYPHHSVLLPDEGEAYRSWSHPARSRTDDFRDCRYCFPYGINAGDVHVLPSSHQPPSPRRRSGETSPTTSDEMTRDEFENLHPNDKREWLKKHSAPVAEWVKKVDREVEAAKKEMTTLEAQNRLAMLTLWIPGGLGTAGCALLGMTGLLIPIGWWTVLGLGRTVGYYYPLFVEKYFGVRVAMWTKRVWEWAKPPLIFTSFVFMGYLFAKYLARRARQQAKKESTSILSDNLDHFVTAVIKPTLKYLGGAAVAFALIDRLESWARDYEVQDTVNMRYNRGKEISNRLAALVGEKLSAPIVNEIFSAKVVQLESLADVDAACVSAGLSVSAHLETAKNKFSNAYETVRAATGRVPARVVQAAAEVKSDIDLAGDKVNNVWINFKDHIKKFSTLYSTVGAFMIGVLIGMWIHYLMECSKMERALGTTPEAASFAMKITEKQHNCIVRIGYEDASSTWHHMCHGFVHADKISSIWHWFETLPGLKHACLIGPDGTRFTVPLVDKNVEDDWAIFARPPNMKGVTAVPISKVRVQLNDDVYMVKYRNLTTPSDKSITDSIVKVADVREKDFGCMNITRNGDCGAPLFNKDGEVVGYHVAGSATLQWARHISPSLTMALSKPLVARSAVGATSSTAATPAPVIAPSVAPKAPESAVGAAVAGATMLAGVAAIPVAPVAGVALTAAGAYIAIQDSELDETKKDLRWADKAAERNEKKYYEVVDALSDADYWNEVMWNASLKDLETISRLRTENSQLKEALKIVGSNPPKTVKELEDENSRLRAIMSGKRTAEANVVPTNDQHDKEKKADAEAAREAGPVKSRGKKKKGKAAGTLVSPTVKGSHHDSQREAAHNPAGVYFTTEEDLDAFKQLHAKCNHVLVMMNYDTWHAHKTKVHSKPGWKGKCDWCRFEKDGVLPAFPHSVKQNESSLDLTDGAAARAAPGPAGAGAGKARGPDAAPHSEPETKM